MLRSNPTERVILDVENLFLGHGVLWKRTSDVAVSPIWYPVAKNVKG